MTDHTIHILPEHLANQIAAGEVVQRPESVVKELVENAVDAGASTITVVVKGAGKQLVHVIDDGGGMSKDDLALATVRHATSKIRNESDLHAIRTMGFRGEALASIAAVADVEMRTRRVADDTGWVLHARPGQTPDVAPWAGDVGTQVIVRNLFANVPARRKFLKSDLTEFRHISETMQKLALARPDRRVVFYDGDVLVFDARPADLRDRIAEILAVDARRQLVPVDATEGGVTVRGYVGLPGIARQSRSGQFLFLNGRPIVSRSVAHAVLTAYEHLLDGGQHPVFVLHLDVDPQRVDVNVHPQKHEVKFDDERSVYLLVQQATASALQQSNVIPAFAADLGLAQRPLQSLPMTPSQGGGGLVVNRLTGEIMPSRAGASPRAATQRGYTAAAREGYDQLMSGLMREETPAMPVLQADGRWLVTTSADGLVVVDQQAAHERILFERVMARDAATQHVGQALLFSVQLRMSAAHAALLREYVLEFEALGFRVDAHADGSVDVHAVPADVRPGSEETVLADMLRELEVAGRFPAERRREGLVAIYAARQAVRRGERLQPDEQSQVVRDLFACAVPHMSPRGVPTYVVIPFDEIGSRFR